VIRSPLLLLLGLPALASAAVAAAPEIIAASDARFRYAGRCDFAAPSAPAIVWAGTRIALEFEGGQLALRFRGATGQNFFDATIDGSTRLVTVPAGAALHRIELPVSSAPGRHRLELFKRSEAAAGEARFAGVELAPGAKAWAPPTPDYAQKMEFIGDSITVGACNEDGDADQWENRATHNHAHSYSTLTAVALRADYRCEAVSGMGIVTGWVDVKAGQIWDRLHPRSDSPRADLHAWQPDIAFVNLGENDGSFTSAHGQPFPSAAFTTGCVALARAIRAAYPRAHLVLLRGGMSNGAQNTELRRAWEAAVTQLESADAQIHHFVFSHWARLHPRVSDDRALAGELIAWLRTQPFVAR